VRALNPGAGAEIERQEAEAKFFRSLVVVGIAWAVLTLINAFHTGGMTNRRWAVWGVSSALVGLLSWFSWKRFKLRWVNSETTYQYFPILTQERGSRSKSNAQAADDHA
jgi:hypothetical protein